MKKMILLFVLTLVGVSALNGMMEKKPELDVQKLGIQKFLLADVRGMLIQKALEASGSLDDAIKNLKSLSVAYNVPFDALFDNLEDFTTLAHMLADKFNLTTNEVAYNINTPIAQDYKHLIVYAKLPVRNYGMLQAIHKGDISRVTDLIEMGADVNFSGWHGPTDTYWTPLTEALLNDKPEIAELLINNGAKLEKWLHLQETLSANKWITNEVKNIMRKQQQKK